MAADMTEQDRHASSRSGARSAVPPSSAQTLIGLGLNKIGRRSTLEDTPAVRGMIAKVAHLVRVVDDASEGAKRDETQRHLATMPARPRTACASAAASARARARPAVAASRARRPAPASPSRASRAARCRCIVACRSAASNPFSTDYNEVNLGRIQQAVDAGKLDARRTVTIEALIAAGVFAKPRDGVKILGQWRTQGQARLRGRARVEVGVARDREGRRLGDAARRSPPQA